jgi:DNA invertase Pin-like site-specific DNA recombinase
MIQESIIADARKRGLILVSATEPDLLGDDPSRILMRQIFGAFAQYEKAMIVAKLKVARTRMKERTGRCEGRKPFGVTEVEREVVARIALLRNVKNYTVKQITADLNDNNVPTRYGGRWHATQVHRILDQLAGHGD